MSSNPGANVVKHTLDGDEKDAASGTETFVHEENGSSRMGIALRVNMGATTTDLLTIDVGMRVPGSSSVVGADDNFSDHFHFSTTVGGTTSGAATTFSASTTDQHVIAVGPW